MRMNLFADIRKRMNAIHIETKKKQNKKKTK